jgi:uncharacterized membrane protein (UPF0127 family)
VRCPTLVVNGKPSGLTVRRCERFLQRARGRLWASACEQRHAWRLSHCAAVHSFFLGEPIDVVFCDAEDRVLRVVAPLGANRWAWQRGAATSWELPVGCAGRLGLQRGDRLSLQADDRRPACE